MGFQIEDGLGSGRKVGVSQANHLNVDAITFTEERSRTARGFTFFLSNAPQADTLTVASGAAGALLFLQNDDTDRALVIERVFFSSSSAAPSSVLKFVRNMTVGTIAANASAAPANLNFGSGITATGTFHVWDETGLTGIGGLTAGKTVATHVVNQLGVKEFPFLGSIILLPGDNFTVHYTQSSGVHEVASAVRFYYQELDGL